MIWAMILELDSKLINLLSKVTQLLLDIASFLILQRQDSFLDRAERLLTHLNQCSLRVLQLDQEVLVHFHLVLLEEHDRALHGFDLVECAVLDHLHITQVSHHLHQVLFVSVGLRGLGRHFYTGGYFINEFLDV